MSKPQLSKVIYLSVDFLEVGRFSFINDPTLRTNIAIYVQYITFLVSLDAEYELGVITYSIYKNIVVHTAQVVESLLHYKLRQLINNGDVQEKDIFGFEEKLLEKKPIYECGHDKVTVFAGLVIKKPIELKNDTNFNALSRAAGKAGLLTKNLEEECDTIRKMRNKIHLVGLEKADDEYSKIDITNLFKMTERIIDRIRDYQSQTSIIQTVLSSAEPQPTERF